MRCKWLIMTVACGLPVVAWSQSADSQPDTHLVDLRLGGQIFTDFTSEVRVNASSGGRNAAVKLENVTDLEQNISIVRFDGQIHFNARHNMAFSYYDIVRTGGRTLNQEVQWENQTYAINTGVKSSYEQEVFKLAYVYDFLSRPSGELGLLLGLHTMVFDLGLRTDDGSQRSEVKATAPLPVLGLAGKYRIGGKWGLVGSAEWLDVTVGDYQGTFTDLVLAVEHDTFKNVGFGIGLNSFDLDVQATSDDFVGNLDLGFDSVLVYVKGSF